MATANQNELRIRGGFDTITATHFRKETLKKGKDLVQHLFNVEEIRSNGKIEIQALIVRAASIKEKPYTIQIEIDNISRTFLDGRCTCIAGISANCKHAAALLHFINNERSQGCTDENQKWKAPSKKLQDLYPKGETIEKLLLGKVTPNSTSLPSNEALSKLASEMERFGLKNSALCKSITADKQQTISMDVEPELLRSDLVTLFDQGDIISGTTPELATDCQKKYEENIVCSPEVATSIFLNTTRQSRCKEWFSARKMRISASRGHLIGNARKKETCLKYFFESSFESANLRYGREMEPKAKEKYKSLTLSEVIDSGLVVKTGQPWLCATPDGIVKDENGDILILEIKCPSSCLDKNINVPYIVNNELKKSHQYYTQVQLQMYCCNLKKAHFFVYSNCDYKLLTVERDEAFL